MIQTSFDPFLQWLVIPFLRTKALLSVGKAMSHTKAPLPMNFGRAGTDGLLSKQTVNSINLQLGKLPYRPDPAAFDYYTHPGVVQNCLNTGDWKVRGSKDDVWSCDCDDFATYAYQLFQLAGARPGFGFWIWNLLVHPAQQIWNAKFNHVILGFRQWDEGRYKTGVLDTNSAAENAVIWFDTPPECAEQAVCAEFGRRYGVLYYRAIQVGYPF